MNSSITIGIDLAKEVFAICVLDERGAVRERRVLCRTARALARAGRAGVTRPVTGMQSATSTAKHTPSLYRTTEKELQATRKSNIQSCTVPSKRRAQRFSPSRQSHACP